MSVSVVIVAYRSNPTLGKCLSSLPENCQVIVVENSPGHRIDRPEVIRVTMPSNVGFGTACNAGLDLATGDLALVLNPDAWCMQQDAVTELVATLRSQNAIAVGGRLVLPNGKVQLSCARRLTLWSVLSEQLLLEKFFHSYWIDTSADTEPRSVPQVTGACFLMRRVDGRFLRFDERFFLYCEDTELMLRLAQHGDVAHAPNAVFGHTLGASSDGVRWSAIACYNRGKELYFAIHSCKVAALLCLLTNRLGALLRLLIWCIATMATLGTVGRFRLRASTFAKVLFAPLDIYSKMRQAPPAP